MTDNITALIGAAHRRVGGIARDSMAERLIAPLAAALAEQTQQREAAEASRDEYARYLSDSELMIVRLRKRAQAAEQNSDQGWGEAVVSSRRARAAESERVFWLAAAVKHEARANAAEVALATARAAATEGAGQ